MSLIALGYLKYRVIVSDGTRISQVQSFHIVKAKKINKKQKSWEAKEKEEIEERASYKCMIMVINTMNNACATEIRLYPLV